LWPQAPNPDDLDFYLRIHNEPRVYRATPDPDKIGFP